MSNKKKIGITTYWESNDNYGQQLQCWALQHFLRERGYDAFLIRQYVWPEQHTTNKKGIKRIKQWLKDAIADVLYVTNLAYKPYVYKRFAFLDKEVCHRQFPKFRKEHMKMSKIYDTPEKLMSHSPQADVYITGSDQVWNYSMPSAPLKNFFLQFGKASTKRIAYAPSIGHSSLTDEMKSIFKQYLSKFDAVSVREKSAVSMLKEIGYEASCVLDPTMLLPTKDYLELSSDINAQESVFIYSMNYASADDIPFEEIKVYAASQHIPIIVTPGSGYLPAKELFEGVEYSYSTIPQWIQYIANAKLVVTASFHGIVFAILFHRPFIYTPLRGEHAGSNNRVLDLLGNLGLQKHILDDNGSIMEICENELNWQEVDLKLKDYMVKSQEFLLSSIEL